MTVLKTRESSTDPTTWDQAAFNASEELFTSIKLYDSNSPLTTNINKSNIENIRFLIDEYVSGKLYLREASQPISKVTYMDHSMHKYYWKMISYNTTQVAINLNGDVGPINGILQTVIKKQKDYGHYNIAKFGITGLVIRLHDKIARLENLLKKDNFQNSVEDESILDTMLDIIGYSIIAFMWLDGTFMLDLES